MSSKGYSNFENCQLNPKCCYESHDLECPFKFNPPLLSTPTEFCTEVLAKGIPIPKCTLARPKKLVIEKEPPPLAKPTTSRHLKNWQRWCYIWRQTYNTITAKRKWENRPPVMSSGESHRYKKEDKELFDRTIHTYHLNGYYIKNPHVPDGLRPGKPCGGERTFQEVITKRYLRDYPEMKRQRYPNYVRNEISLAPRKGTAGRQGSKAGSKSFQSSGKSGGGGFNWEEKWAHTRHVEKMKETLQCEIGLYGKSDPIPDTLIFKPVVMKDGPSERKTGNKKGGNDLTVPQLVFSNVEDEDDDSGTVVSRDSMSMSTAYEERERQNSKEYYMVTRGPILRIRSQSAEIVLTFSKATSELPHFINNPAAVSSTPVENYMCDENHHFSITTKCKDMKYIVMKNEGTTAIRYQWFRNPPNSEAHKMLQNPKEFRSVRLSQQLERDKGQENVLDMESSEAVAKNPHLEFHFSELPDVILPGQFLDFPIIFRSKKPGYFHETIYLLTHPRVNTSDGRYYSVGLSGVCTEIELVEKGNEIHETENLKRYLSSKILEEESTDLMDSIVDQSLWGATHNNPSSPSVSSLPNGRITAEGIFYAHNKDYYYYFGRAEKALALIHKLTGTLVPKERTPKCDFSIQYLYDQVMTAREETDLIWEQMRTSETDDLLAELNECMLTLCEPRVFTCATTERRKYVACYANLVVTFDEILVGFDKLHNFYDAEIIKQIDDKQVENLISEYVRNEMEQNIFWGEDEDFNDDDLEGSEGYGEMIEVESNSENVPPLTDSIPMDATDEMKTTTEIADENLSPVPNLVTESKLIDLMMTEPNPLGDGDEEEEDGSIIIKKKPPSEKVHTVLPLDETMKKRVADDRRKVVTEVRIKLFEDLFCDGLERMLSIVDSFNNMLDYKPSDAVVCIDDLC